MANSANKIAVLIVAAGESKRLGQPKQLLLKNNFTLLEFSLNEIIKSKFKNIFLVLGANADLILRKIQIIDFQVVINEDWKNGMGGSIAFGMQTIVMDSNYNGVIICVADQPFLTANVLKEIKENIREEKMIIKSKYEEGSGPPVYFSKHYFSELSQLKGDDGAKSLIKKYRNELINIDFLKGNIDIDTEEDLKYWR